MLRTVALARLQAIPGQLPDGALTGRTVDRGAREIVEISSGRSSYHGNRSAFRLGERATAAYSPSAQREVGSKLISASIGARDIGSYGPER